MRKSKGRKEFPKFERDGDRLVKIGWSKKDRRTYEHRAPKSVVIAVIDQIAAGVKPGRVFTMEQLMPFRDADGQDIPAYQPYLVLKWLQHVGAVKKKGKDGYVAQGGALEGSSIGSAFEILP